MIAATLSPWGALTSHIHRCYQFQQHESSLLSFELRNTLDAILAAPSPSIPALLTLLAAIRDHASRIHVEPSTENSHQANSAVSTESEARVILTAGALHLFAVTIAEVAIAIEPHKVSHLQVAARQLVWGANLARAIDFFEAGPLEWGRMLLASIRQFAETALLMGLPAGIHFSRRDGAVVLMTASEKAAVLQQMQLAALKTLGAVQRVLGAMACARTVSDLVALRECAESLLSICLTDDSTSPSVAAPEEAFHYCRRVSGFLARLPKLRHAFTTALTPLQSRSAWQRAWWRRLLYVSVGLSAVVVGYTYRNECATVLNDATISLNRFYIEHVREPASAIVGELFGPNALGGFGMAPLHVADPRALEAAQVNLQRMLSQFYRTLDRSTLSADLANADLETLAQAGDMRPAMEAFANESRHALRGIFIGDLAQSVLVQVEFLKKELLVAMAALDTVMAQNRFNLQIMAAIPAAVVFYAAIHVLNNSITAVSNGIAAATGRNEDSAGEAAEKCLLAFHDAETALRGTGDDGDAADVREEEDDRAIARSLFTLHSLQHTSYLEGQRKRMEQVLEYLLRKGIAVTLRYVANAFQYVAGVGSRMSNEGIRYTATAVASVANRIEAAAESVLGHVPREEGERHRFEPHPLPNDEENRYIHPLSVPTSTSSRSTGAWLLTVLLSPQRFTSSQATHSQQQRVEPERENDDGVIALQSSYRGLSLARIGAYSFSIRRIAFYSSVTASTSTNLSFALTSQLRDDLFTLLQPHMTLEDRRSLLASVIQRFGYYGGMEHRRKNRMTAPYKHDVLGSAAHSAIHARLLQLLCE